MSGVTCAGFDQALRGTHCVLEFAGGDAVVLPVTRWHAEPDAADELLLRRCHGATLDVGCGPGRLTVALARRGIPALGVDVSPVAVRLTRRRGGSALRRDVFDPVPGAGRWRHVLLADGNVGIGGDPAALLRRIAQLLAPAGTALVELAAPGSGLRQMPVRLCGATRSGATRSGATRSGATRSDTAPAAWFPWAILGVDALPAAIRDTGLRACWLERQGERWFAELVADK